MASGTITGAGGGTSYTSSDNLSVAMEISNVINTGLSAGNLTAFTYSGSGAVAPVPESGNAGVLMVTTPTSTPVVVGGGDPYIDVTAAGPVSLQGGEAGETLLAGAGLLGAERNISYTNITPSDAAIDTIVVTGGNNLIQTATVGTGNYNVFLGSGDDTVNALVGNATINAATGKNVINLGAGNNLITSVGYDAITGSAVGGADTVNVTSGQTSITSGTSSFLVNDTSPNPITVTLGSGVDTVNLGGGAATIEGANTTTTASSGVVRGTGTPTGDSIMVTGGAATVVAGALDDAIRASSGNNLLQAGTGNDTLVAGSGADTLTGAVGGASSALLTSGLVASTTFSFTFGQSGGANVITGFKSSDVLSFTGYGTAPQSTAIKVGNSTVLTLADQTTITLVGMNPAAGQYITK